MKIFPKVSVKALAIVASTLMFSASIAHAESCTTTCGNYAHGAGMQAKNDVIQAAPTMCASALQQGGQSAYNSCYNAITTSYANYVYTTRYNQVMAECMAVCRP